jgi:hypothetical protein
MLFDLRGRGRRRTVRVIYTGLALLMGVGLVGFGIGGGFNGGGLLNAANNNEGSSSASFSSQIKTYKKLTKQQPTNASAWEKLANAELHEAGSEAYVSRTGAVTSKGKELYSQVAQSWGRYLALNPAKPKVELAQRMLPVFGEEGLNQAAQEVQVLQIVLAARPTSASLYSSLALYSYKLHDLREGDLASQKAISLAQPLQRPRLKTELAALRKNPNGNGTTTAKTEGNSNTVRPGASGTLTTINPTTTPTPAGSSSSKKK